VTKTRLEAFSDGVIAIAITLLVLEIRVPPPGAEGTLAHKLGEQWPSYAAYVVSFLTIGVIWINHHAMLRRLKAVDHAVLFRNLLLLLCIGILPWSTALMADYLREGQGQHLAAALYAGSFLAMAVAFYAMQRHVLFAKAHLLDERLGPEERRLVERRNRAGLVPYAVAIAAAALSSYLTLAICAAIAVFYALPSTTSDSSESSG
jgi:uncharacterized membrane protein